jgi:hypothetical protein
MAGVALLPFPLPIGSVASSSIKGKGFASHFHLFGACPAGCAPRAASGVALNAASSQYTGHDWRRTRERNSQNAATVGDIG